MEFIRRGTDYALISLIYMARFPKGKIFNLKSIAKKRKISPEFLHKIFQRLAKAGIVVSHRGLQGGFSIAKDPAMITVRDILEVVQGPIALNICLDGDKCDRTPVCSLRKNLDSTQRRFIATLDRLTLKKLAKEEMRF